MRRAKALSGAFEQRWRRCMDGLGVDASASAEVLAELRAAYEGSGRHYHDIDHIEELLALAGRFAAMATDAIALDLAIYFHDAVYDVSVQDNEARSANLARACLLRLGCVPARVDAVCEAVLATRHNSDVVLVGDAALLADLDLSILAADSDRYDWYAAAIRQEYGIYPDEVYREGRARALQGFMRRARMFTNRGLAELWERPARANIERELSTLL